MAEQSAKQPTTVRDRLRAQTRCVHEQLHHHSTFVDLFKNTISLDDYKALILRFYGFYVPLERAIERVFAGMSNDSSPYFYKTRAHHLKIDLRDLGFDPSEIKNAPLCGDVFDVVSKTSLGGVLYVIEGSTLGAAPIDRAAQRLLSGDVLDGRRFWAWCRSQNKNRWSLTNDYIETLETNGIAFGHLARGANDTFQALADWLAPMDHNNVALDTREVFA